MREESHRKKVDGSIVVCRAAGTASRRVEGGTGRGEEKKCLKISLRIANVVRSTCTTERQRRNYSPAISGYLLKDLVSPPSYPVERIVKKENSRYTRARVKCLREKEENKVNTIVCKENGLNARGWIAKAVHL